MNVCEKNIVVLDDDNSYAVVRKIKFNGFYCYCFIDINNYENIKFLYEKGDKLVEIEDENEIDKMKCEMGKDLDINKIMAEFKAVYKDNN